MPEIAPIALGRIGNAISFHRGPHDAIKASGIDVVLDAEIHAAGLSFQESDSVPRFRASRLLMRVWGVRRRQGQRGRAQNVRDDGFVSPIRVSVLGNLFVSVRL